MVLKVKAMVYNNSNNNNSNNSSSSSTTITTNVNNDNKDKTHSPSLGEGSQHGPEVGGDGVLIATETNTATQLGYVVKLVQQVFGMGATLVLQHTRLVGRVVVEQVQVVTTQGRSEAREFGFGVGQGSGELYRGEDEVRVGIHVYYILENHISRIVSL